MPVKAGSLHEFPARAKGQGIMAAGLSLWAIECGGMRLIVKGSCHPARFL